MKCSFGITTSRPHAFRRQSVHSDDGWLIIGLPSFTMAVADRGHAGTRHLQENIACSTCVGTWTPPGGIERGAPFSAGFASYGSHLRECIQDPTWRSREGLDFTHTHTHIYVIPLSLLLVLRSTPTRREIRDREVTVNRERRLRTYVVRSRLCLRLP